MVLALGLRGAWELTGSRGAEEHKLEGRQDHSDSPQVLRDMLVSLETVRK